MLTKTRKIIKPSKVSNPDVFENPKAFVERYMEQVLDGSIPAARLVIQAVKRQKYDLKTGKDRGLKFNEDAAKRPIMFSQYLRHWKGEWGPANGKKGQVFKPSPWQAFIDWCIFGWQREDKTRRFRSAYIEVPRKCGKSFWISKNGLYLLIADGEPASEVVSFATKKEQARIIAENVAAFINASETLKGKFVISGGRYVNNISYAKTASKLEPIGADSKTADGLNVSAGLGDELHEHPSSAMWDVIETAMGARRQPLLLGITTAGADSDSFCGQLHDYAEKLLLDFDLDNGIKNDSFFAFVSAAEKTDDWTSPEVWAKANPNYGISVKPDVLADACQKAKSIPSARNAFLRKHLNIWTQQIEAWIPIEMWDKCEDRTFNSSRLIGQPCWGGLDLSSKLDLTAFVLLFAPSEETGNKYRILPFFWIPEDTAAERERLDRIPYQEWIDQGLIFATPGNVVDYATVESKIVELSKIYQLKDVGFDLWNAEATSQRLREIHGIETFEFRQGMASMNEPCKEYEKIIASKELRHDGNAVMRWMVGNVSIKTDEAGNIRPIKPQGPMSRKRVDGVVATVMALGRAILKPNDTDFDFRIV